MPINTLTSQAGLKLGPLVLETLVRHYFERLIKDGKGEGSEGTTALRQEELMYDQAFNIVKDFMDASSKHTVEEVQNFSNTRTPSPPWVIVVRLLVPTSCCDEAAAYLIRVLGGEQKAKQVVGGTKWWQVRGLKGVNCEWIAAKRDWQEYKKRQKAKGKTNGLSPNIDVPQTGEESSGDSGAYNPEMDEMRCLLYLHGGGYYFGSVDQERYMMQRFARKINGRVFGVNYRLAPQYPFPCALQDALAAYLYLIRPPEGAAHRPVSPAHLIVGGDSAGGGLTLALLQVLRDTNLPLPAGGVLISPWCDLTHSFPSVHTNTATDVLPQYGLSFHKPSVLWPPPSEELTNKVHAGLRSRIRQAVRLDVPSSSGKDELTPTVSKSRPRSTLLFDSSGKPIDVGSTASLPSLDANEGQTVTFQASNSEELTIHQQIQLYVPNNLLAHPLVSPATAYLGGLPPLLVIASDREVLRDEIIYVAHKAAHPDRYPVREEARQLYPPLENTQGPYVPTRVHLQVYDDTAHVLPILFSFTTPAKFCYRSIATFCKYVTGMLPSSPRPAQSTFDLPPMPLSESPRTLTPNSDHLLAANGQTSPSSPRSVSRALSNPSLPHFPHSPNGDNDQHSQSPSTSTATPLKFRSRSVKIGKPKSVFRRPSFARGATKHVEIDGAPSTPKLNDSADVAGPRFHLDLSKTKSDTQRTGGDPSVYESLPDSSCWEDNMIRERVSIEGVIRPLEPEEELPALKVPPEVIGVISELAARRYLEGQRVYEKRFARTAKSIAKQRQRNLERAKKDAVRDLSHLQRSLQQDDRERNPAKPSNRSRSSSRSSDEDKGTNLASSGSWSLAWALDEDEHPPPSSIASRRDTEEARDLAKIADQIVAEEPEKAMSGNNLWSIVANFLTVTPEREHVKKRADDEDDGNETGQGIMSRFLPHRKGRTSDLPSE